MERRTFLMSLAAGGGTALAAGSGIAAGNDPSLRFLRPPGALPEDEFQARCIRCGQCSESCPNECIKFFNFENGIASFDTPYIIPREKACVLCMKCGAACPTGALTEIPRTAEDILAGVRMGKARVNENLCLSYQGKTCGVCYRACPLQDVSIRVGYLEQPHVLDDCIGCGLCERACIQMPQAIRIFPDHERKIST